MGTVEDQDDHQVKDLHWATGAHKELLEFPEEAMQAAGYALHLAQCGDKHPDAKPLSGFNGASVLEIVLDDDGSTYRAVYTVKFDDVVVVLHAFQKKSKKGIKTPQSHINIIKKRLEAARKEFGGKK